MRVSSLSSGMLHSKALTLTMCLIGVQLSLAAAVGPDLTGSMSQAKALQAWLRQTYRELHQWPELMFEEHNTSRFIRGTLDDLSIPYQYAAFQQQ